MADINSIPPARVPTRAEVEKIRNYNVPYPWLTVLARLDEAERLLRRCDYLPSDGVEDDKLLAEIRQFLGDEPKGTPP